MALYLFHPTVLYLHDLRDLSLALGKRGDQSLNTQIQPFETFHILNKQQIYIAPKGV